MDEILKKYSSIRHLNVSRETCLDFEKLITMILDRNKRINIISRETTKSEEIRQRHIIDSAQAIEFVDFNSNTTYDIGSGGGFPGIVIAIMMKNMKKNMKINLCEKSHHKCLFLKEVSRKLKLDTEVIHNDIFNAKVLEAGTIMTRAFKPLPIVLDLVHQNFKSFKNLILFMGKTGEKILNDTLKEWNLDFEKKKSNTSADSFLLNIKNIKKIEN